MKLQQISVETGEWCNLVNNLYQQRAVLENKNEVWLSLINNKIEGDTTASLINYTTLFKKMQTDRNVNLLLES